MSNMGSDYTREITKAEQRARAYAKLATDAGLEAEVSIEFRPEEYYRDGDVMFSARTIAWVTIREAHLGVFGDKFAAGWSTRHPAKGHRASTRWLSGRLYTLIRMRKFTSEKKFAYRLHVSLDCAPNGRYAKEREI